MFRMNRFFVLATVLVVSVGLPVTGQASPADFLTQARDLELMHRFFAGGNGQPVTLDSQGAKDNGFSTESIKLGEEMAAATNDTMTAINNELKEFIPLRQREAIISTQAGDVSATEAGVQNQRRIRGKNYLPINMEIYPTLKAFLDLATEHRRQLEALSESAQRAMVDSERAMMFAGTPMASVSGVLNALDPYAQCGSYSNPLPNRAQTHVPFTSNDPAATLQSWGYHDDPLAIRIGAGWTRAHTYQWWICGWDTFRDNANPTGPTTFWEQNYSGWTPPGEPNPEFWRSGPWPYLEWPIYVNWWHATY